MSSDSGAADPRGSGEWGLFVARAVMEIRQEFGEVAANRVATLLLAQKADAVEAGREHLATTDHLLEQALAELKEARAERDHLRAELTDLHAAVRDAKVDLEAQEAAAAGRLATRRAEIDAEADAANQRVADAWEELRAHEAEVATRRSELLRVEDVIGERLAEAESRLIDADNMRAAAAADRQEAQRLVDEATRNWQAARSLAEGYDGVRAAADYAAKVEETVIELRETAVTGEERRALDERDLELREWEAELVRRTREIDLRDEATRRRDDARRYLEDRPDPPPGSSWGRRRRR